ncbi:MAG TPA: undecaprenyldiphospho-muramoylpentapeptide beta-N-acetylglucosaminyltransferase [Lachnospiraceae bacterium]|nr:undecaprenyldiphospho-muramoylpentapeptide beta-N-acetylglucosaminyltransferase [Lachnospiraceae bacterium]
MKRIILTGGGTAGHVTPNIALIPELQKRGYEIHYIGSKTGIEKELIGNFDIPYYGISSGKLRRYFDVKNFTDPFRILKGYTEADKLIKKIKPDVVFSKGGFVTVPVVKAAKRRKVPCVLHESDISPGLANRLCLSSATAICANFPETLENLPEDKAYLTGSPIRSELFSGNRLKGLDFCNLTANKPVILVIGGSLGSVRVNEAVREILPQLLETYQVIHLCGKDKVDEDLKGTTGYVQYEYIQKELCDILDAADIVISRAGANAICELLALHKPNILIPLSLEASRGDQILNAASFEKQGFSYVIKEEDLTSDKLLEAVQYVSENKQTYKAAMSASNQQDAVIKVADIIEKTALFTD